MSSTIGNNLKVGIFGESHGKAIGAVIENLPPGEAVDIDELTAFLARRRPGRNALSTPRKEADLPVFLSGLYNGKTTGTPLCAVIENGDVRSSDYSELEHKPRPAHADYTAYVKYKGFADMRGGGHFSGRLTAPLCIAGGIAKQILKRRGVEIYAHIYSIGEVKDKPFEAGDFSDDVKNMLAESALPVLNEEAGQKMTELIKKAGAAQDSVGGIVECAVLGLGAGIGAPMFGGVESRLAQMFFGIPAVKGVEFGSGFEGSAIFGSENNDGFYVENGTVKTETNNHGGILGGITTGMPVTARIAFKPTPSIARAQKTVDLKTMSDTEIKINGRHDPTVVIRAVPVIEAAAAITALDLLMD